MESKRRESADPHATCSTFLNTNDNRTPSIWSSKRLLVMILLVLGKFLNTVACLTGTMAVIEMTTAKQIVQGNTTIVQPPAFQWDSVTVGQVLNMVWFGGLLAPVGGTLTQIFGGSVTSGVSLLIIGLSSVAAPIAMSCHFYLFLACRGLAGVLIFFFLSANPAIFSTWIPKKERPVFISAIVTGTYVAIAIVHPFCGFIAYHWGWKMIFYSTGFINIGWAIAWLILVQNDPSDDRWISRKELIYILDQTGETDRDSNCSSASYPYKEIITSAPFWTISLGRAALAWNTTITAVFFPLYINDRSGKNVEIVGYISSIPQIFCAILIPIASILMGYWQKHTNLKTTTFHKFVFSGDLIIPSVLYAIIPFIGDFLEVNLCFMTVIAVLVSYNWVILELITVNMAPNHCGLVSGLLQCFQAFGSVVPHIVVGLVVKNHRMDEWNVCFYTTSAVLLISAVVFICYGSSEAQSWSMKNNSNTNDVRYFQQNKELL